MAERDKRAEETPVQAEGGSSERSAVAEGIARGQRADDTAGSRNPDGENAGGDGATGGIVGSGVSGGAVGGVSESADRTAASGQAAACGCPAGNAPSHDAVRIEPTARWLRVKVGDEWIADSKHAIVLFEQGRLPVYYFPKSDVRFGLLRESAGEGQVNRKGRAKYWDVVADGKVVPRAAWEYPDPTPGSEGLRGYVSFVWDAVDHWYEEETEIFVHARDPYTRVDAIPSSRHVQVTLNGAVVADSTRPVVLFETGLTPRYYLPKEDIRFEYFTPTETKTRCPYKGIASYWSADVDGKHYEDVLWSYPDPIPEIPTIKGLYSFYNESVDLLTVDGERWALAPHDRLPYKKVPTDQLDSRESE